MSRFSRLIPAVVVAFLLAACGQGNDNPVGPAGPMFDGGVLTTGGNRTDSDSTQTGTNSAGTTTTTTPVDDDEGEVPSDSTSRGGVLTTGGN